MFLFIKYLPITLSSLLIIYRITNAHCVCRRKIIFTISITLTIIASITLFSSSFIRFLLIFVFSFFFAPFICNCSLINSFTITLISYGLSFGVYIIALMPYSLLYALIFYPNHTNTSPYYFIFLLVVGLTQYTIIFYLSNIPQFIKGLFSLIRNKSTKLGVIISLLIAIYISYVSDTISNSFLTKLTVFLICVLFALLIPHYWRYCIKQTYIENMRRLEILSYENTIMDKDKQIKGLKQDNAELGQIIHKYRKVIPAMELSVTELLQNSSTLSAAELHDRASELQTQLAELRNERNNLLDKYQKDTIVTAQSGLHTVDAMIALMGKRAKQEGIRYKTQIDPTLKELALNSVKESDLLHLLGDMVENAIHAVSLSDEKEILIHMGKLNDCLLLEISDSGIAFDIETYQHFGNEPFTSHKSDGGSGTGLMDMWKLKKTYKASLYIYEYSSEYGVYTKKISLLFDRKNHFLLKTYRDKEIKNSLIRGDLYVFPYQTD